MIEEAKKQVEIQKQTEVTNLDKADENIDLMAKLQEKKKQLLI